MFGKIHMNNNNQETVPAAIKLFVSTQIDNDFSMNSMANSRDKDNIIIIGRMRMFPN